MTEYNEYIRELADELKNVVFYNSGPEHAALVMGTIFSKSNEIVKLYAGSFSGDVSAKEYYTKALEGFLNRGGKLQILLQKEKLEKKIKEKGEPTVFDLLKYYSIINPGSISIKIHPFQIIKENGGREIHFTVGDNRMYRLEDDVDNFTAVGNFNDPNESKELAAIFDKIFSDPQSKELNLLKKRDLVS